MTFTLTTNAIPSDGGTVTLLHTELTKGEFNWGENAIIKAKQSDGYIFSHWSSDTYTGIIGGVINTCLLYTSPSPRDGLLSRMPSSA